MRCLDLYMEPFIGTYTCYQMGQNQFFAFTVAGRIHTYREEFCVGLSDDEQYITVERCNRTDDAQLWRYDKSVSAFHVGCEQIRCISLAPHN